MHNRRFKECGWAVKARNHTDTAPTKGLGHVQRLCSKIPQLTKSKNSPLRHVYIAGEFK